MTRHRRASLLAAAAFLLSQGSGAQESLPALTLEQALARAREHAPLLRAARLRVEEARGRLAGASLRLRENPVVEAAAGRRDTGSASEEELELGFSQTFETGGRRDARIASANAAIERAAAEAESAERRLLRDVAVGFHEALHARELVELAGETERLSREALRTAQRRHELGEVPLLDVHVARLGAAASRSAIETAEAAARTALGGLRRLLGAGAEEAFVVVGELDAAATFDLPALLVRAAERPQLRAIAAELREAEAEARLGKGQASPELGLGVRYAREEGDDIVLGGVSIALPVFDRGQGLRAEAGARARRLGVELEAARRSAEVEVRTAFEAWRHRVDAVQALRQDGLVALEETERLAQRAYETGAFGVGELLVLRRETVNLKRQYLDRLLEAAVAAIELETAAGIAGEHAAKEEP
jgi:cobalt-zinc-cadmium efflux system outer membrane protein